MKFDDNMQRALHEVNTWHCMVCGFSDGKELTMDNITKPCNLCIYDKYGHPKKKPVCILILVDCKSRRYKRLRKKGDKDE